MPKTFSDDKKDNPITNMNNGQHQNLEMSREVAMEAIFRLREQAKKNGIADMSLSEINKEIKAARRARTR
ncbi:MAG: hypothetical protein J5768_04735 [Spirochaetales bacterium]|nr:hypothetical protein [Spirochaetales bacterium]